MARSLRSVLAQWAPPAPKHKATAERLMGVLDAADNSAAMRDFLRDVFADVAAHDKAHPNDILGCKDCTSRARARLGKP